MALLLGLLDPEDEGTIIFQNIINHLPDTVPHPRDLPPQQHYCENLMFPIATHAPQAL
jgi:hypothetical protein